MLLRMSLITATLPRSIGICIPVVMTGQSKALKMYVEPCLYNWPYIKDPVPLVEKSRALCPSGRIPPDFIH